MKKRYIKVFSGFAFLAIKTNGVVQVLLLSAKKKRLLKDYWNCLKNRKNL